MVKRLAFAVPGELSTPTGGYAYDRRMIAELEALGWTVERVNLGENFPWPAKETRATAEARLLMVPENCPIIVDGLALGAMMLAVAPHLVRADEIKKLQTTPGADAVRATILDQSVTWPWTTSEKAIAANGVIGDAKSASAEFGKQLLEKITDAAGGVFTQLLERQQLLRG